MVRWNMTINISEVEWESSPSIDLNAVEWDKPKQKKKKVKSNRARDVTRQLLQGATFGGADELGSAISAAVSPLVLAAQGLPDESGGFFSGFGKRYDQDMERLKQERKAFKSSNPKEALALELAGGLSSGIISAPKIAALPFINTMRQTPKLASVGAIEGGTYGGLSADQGERISGTATGGTVGAVMGPTAQFATDVVGKLGAPVADRVRSAFTGSPAGDARKYLADLLTREGIDSVDQLKSDVGRVPVTLADRSQGARGALEGLVSDTQSPGIRRLAKDTLETRNQQQQQRLFDAVDENLNIPSSATVKDAVDTLKTQRSNTAQKLYGEAAQTPIQVTQNIERLTGPSGPLEIRNASRKAFNRALTKMSTGELKPDPRVAQVANQQLNEQIARLTSATDSLSMQPSRKTQQTIEKLRKDTAEKVINDQVRTSYLFYDELKKELDDTIGNLLQKESRKNRAIDLIALKNQMLRDLDNQSPAYKQARDAWAGDTQLINAAEEGKKILRADADYLDDLISGYSQSEKQLFRLGAKKAIREKLMQAREGTNSVNRIASEINLDRMRRAFPDQASFNRFRDEIRLEADIFDTSRVLHNSMTALRQSAQKEMSTTQGPLTDLGSDQAGIVVNGVNRLLRSGLDDQAKLELGKMLLKPIDELPENLMVNINQRIARELPPDQLPYFQMLLRDASEFAPTVIGATVPAMATNE